MKKIVILVFAILLINITGCAGMSDTQQRTMTGGLGGAAGGAVIGAIAGNAGMGAAIGAVAGTAGGYLYGKHKEAEQRAYQQGRSDAQSSH
jgi:osmotically inducible lipoprotein OsmB